MENRHTKFKPGTYGAVTTAMLKDTRALLEWRTLNLGGRESDDRDKLFLLEAAERALESRENPASLFVWIFKGNHRDRITLTQEDRARQRLKRWHDHERTERYNRDPWLKNLVEQMMAGKGVGREPQPNE
jgi:hypothetical protein